MNVSHTQRNVTFSFPSVRHSGESRNPAGFRSPVLDSGFATTRSGNQAMQSRRNDKLTFIADQENCFNDRLELPKMLPD
ncbi:MAG: hypothetical protein K9J74_04370 [Sulfuritalea sp.]|nr:hypothetical protein [Sulfuritalea sp.]